MKIKKIIHPYAWELNQARRDEAIVTNQPIVERPFWYENTETGQCYYDLYGCIGWPTDVSGGRVMPGYVAVVGVVKPKEDGKTLQDVVFQLLAEGESRSVPAMLEMIVRLRQEYGFGLHPELLQGWYGDPDRFIMPVALKNERLTQQGKERAEILIIPSTDYCNPDAFKDYMHALQGVLVDKRLFFGNCKILRKHLHAFERGNPAVMAVGGLVYTLLGHCMWADPSQDAAFVVEEGF